MISSSTHPPLLPPFLQQLWVDHQQQQQHQIKHPSLASQKQLPWILQWLDKKQPTVQAPQSQASLLRPSPAHCLAALDLVEKYIWPWLESPACLSSLHSPLVASLVAVEGPVLPLLILACQTTCMTLTQSSLMEGIQRTHLFRFLSCAVGQVDSGSGGNWALVQDYWRYFMPLNHFDGNHQQLWIVQEWGWAWAECMGCLLARQLLWCPLSGMEEGQYGVDVTAAPLISLYFDPLTHLPRFIQPMQSIHGATAMGTTTGTTSTTTVSALLSSRVYWKYLEAYTKHLLLFTQSLLVDREEEQMGSQTQWLVYAAFRTYFYPLMVGVLGQWVEMGHGNTNGESRLMGGSSGANGRRMAAVERATLQDICAPWFLFLQPWSLFMQHGLVDQQGEGRNGRGFRGSMRMEDSVYPQERRSRSSSLFSSTVPSSITTAMTQQQKNTVQHAFHAGTSWWCRYFVAENLLYYTQLPLVLLHHRLPCPLSRLWSTMTSTSSIATPLSSLTTGPGSGVEGGEPPLLDAGVVQAWEVALSWCRLMQATNGLVGLVRGLEEMVARSFLRWPVPVLEGGEETGGRGRRRPLFGTAEGDELAASGPGARLSLSSEGEMTDYEEEEAMEREMVPVLRWMLETLYGQTSYRSPYMTQYASQPSSPPSHLSMRPFSTQHAYGSSYGPSFSSMGFPLSATDEALHSPFPIWPYTPIYLTAPFDSAPGLAATVNTPSASPPSASLAASVSGGSGRCPHAWKFTEKVWVVLVLQRRYLRLHRRRVSSPSGGESPPVASTSVSSLRDALQMWVVRMRGWIAESEEVADVKAVEKQRRWLMAFLEALQRVYLWTPEEMACMEAQAEQRVVTASGSAMNLMGPETDPRNPSRLTRRGRQQIRAGLKKFDPRQVMPVVFDPSNPEHVRPYEIRLLVPHCVRLGFFLESHWERALIFVDGQLRQRGSTMTVPHSVRSIPWMRISRVLAWQSFWAWVVIYCILRLLFAWVMSWFAPGGSDFDASSFPLSPDQRTVLYPHDEHVWRDSAFP